MKPESRRGGPKTNLRRRLFLAAISAAAVIGHGAWGAWGAETVGTAAAPVASEPEPIASPLAPLDLVLDLRLERLERMDGAPVAFAFLEKEYRRDPRAHVRARYGEFLLGGKARGGPAGRAGEGLALVRGALREGSLQAMRIMGWELLAAEHVPADTVRGLSYLLQAATLGCIEAMHYLGEAYCRGQGLPQNLPEGETWIRRVAQLGNPRPLFALAQSLEKRPGAFANACQLYYEAAVRGSQEAKLQLDAVVTQGHPAALRAHKLVAIWLATRGIEVERTFLRQALRYLEEKHGNEPEVLIAIAQYHVAATNTKLAAPLLERAVRLGSLDARAELAGVLARAQGNPAARFTAIAELRTLEGEGNPTALALLGYYHYWDSLSAEGLKKDPERAFLYSRRAAQQGSPEGQANVAFCYEFGIGTPVDLALASFYYRAAAMKGDRRGQEKYPTLLAFVK